MHFTTNIVANNYVGDFDTPQTRSFRTHTNKLLCYKLVQVRVVRGKI